MLSRVEVERFWADGFLVLEGVCLQEVGACRRRFDELVGQPGDGSSVFVRFGASGARVFVKIPQIAARDAVFGGLARQPRLCAAVSDLVGQAAVFRDVVVAKPPRGGSRVHYHQDAAYWDTTDPDVVVSAWIALDDATTRSGCLKVIPGSHRSPVPHHVFLSGRRLPRAVTAALRGAVSLTGTGDNPRHRHQRFFARAKALVLGQATRLVPALNDLNELTVDPATIPGDRELEVPVRAGDAILFHSRLLHASGPNTSEADRRAYIVTYSGAALAP